ncbi:GtrA family protein [Pseudomonas sp. TE50-2]|uniref:GtrA family protein n=1 Tax=Pseudomonas sp. TE50-2 TaxID=3142707 RepID=UPI003467A321
MISLRRFGRYGLVGIGNTLAHWLVFLALHQVAGVSQAISNLVAFSMAASLSYYMNANYTFAVRPSKRRYGLFLAGMGCLSLVVGALSDHIHLSPWLTLMSFSVVSLMVGYAYSHAVVFRRRDP